MEVFNSNYCKAELNENNELKLNWEDNASQMNEDAFNLHIHMALMTMTRYQADSISLK
jgi:hypothetical protein